MENKTNKESITINKKILWAIAPVVAISAVLISKHQPGQLFLFMIGVAGGIFIQRAINKK